MNTTTHSLLEIKNYSDMYVYDFSLSPIFCYINLSCSFHFTFQNFHLPFMLFASALSISFLRIISFPFYSPAHCATCSCWILIWFKRLIITSVSFCQRSSRFSRGASALRFEDDLNLDERLLRRLVWDGNWLYIIPKADVTGNDLRAAATDLALQKWLCLCSIGTALFKLDPAGPLQPGRPACTTFSCCSYSGSRASFFLFFVFGP